MQAIVVCRSAREYLKPNHVYGHNCTICNSALQVSPEGVVQIAGGGIPLCNPCGFKLADEMRHRVAGVFPNPAAVRTLKGQE
jgi:hypothetical protein